MTWCDNFLIIIIIIIKCLSFLSSSVMLVDVVFIHFIIK